MHKQSDVENCLYPQLWWYSPFSTPRPLCHSAMNFLAYSYFRFPPCMRTSTAALYHLDSSWWNEFWLVSANLNLANASLAMVAKCLYLWVSIWLLFFLLVSYSREVKSLRSAITHFLPAFMYVANIQLRFRRLFIFPWCFCLIQTTGQPKITIMFRT